MIHLFLKDMSRYHHHHHHVTPIIYNHATHILTIYHHIYNITYHPSPLHVSTP